MIPKIVYFDDHPIRDPLSLTLELKGYQIATARNGIECIELARTWAPHFIFMDLRMPDIGGLQAIKTLRQDAKTANIPIFVLSAWTTKTYREQAFTAGANEFFAKPADLNRLLRTITSYLEKLPPEAKSSVADSSTNQTLGVVSQVFGGRGIPYIVGSPIVDPKMFFGRKQIIQKIISKLHNNSIILTGSRRIGKTSLLYQLKNRLVSLDSSDHFFIPVLIDVQGVLEQNFFQRVMDEIVITLSEYLSEQTMLSLNFTAMATTYSDRAFGQDLGRIIQTLQHSQPDKEIKLVLLMDEMDVLNSFDQVLQSQLRSIFIRFTKNLRAVVVGVNLDQEWKRHESPFYNMFPRIVLGPLSPEEAQQLIIQPVHGQYHYDDTAITRILTATEGHPFRLQQLCLEIIERVVEEKRQQITLADVEATLVDIQWTEEGAKKPDDETLTQPTPVASTVVTEKRASYNASISTPKNEETE